MPTGIRINKGKLVLTKNNINQGLTNSDGWSEAIPKSSQRLEPRVMWFNKIGSTRNMQETMKMRFFEEIICLGLIWVPMIRRNTPITHEISCFDSSWGARELTIRRLIQKSSPRLMITGSQKLLRMDYIFSTLRLSPISMEMANVFLRISASKDFGH
jgi:hypothetical protein